MSSVDPIPSAENLWPAPKADSPVIGAVRVPGSKSITNRALIIAANSASPSTIANALNARDTRLMVTGLRMLGIQIEDSQPGILSVTPSDPVGNVEIYCGLSGTTMRFLPPLCARASGSVSFDGDEQARQRPTGPTVDAIRQLGVDVTTHIRDSLPFVVESTGHVSGHSVVIDSHESSQFVSGLLLSGARFSNGLNLRHQGPPVPSLPHIAMTVSMLEKAGAQISYNVDDPTDASWQVLPGKLELGNLVIEPDLSNATAFMAAAMVTQGAVTIKDWPIETSQPGDHIRTIFTALGGLLTHGPDGLTVSGPQQINGIDMDLGQVGELVPTVAAIACFAGGPSRITGIKHLRGHETDRITALVTEINKLGGNASELADGFTIEPQPLRSGIVDSYRDHRMATFGAILGLIVPGISVLNIATTSKTMPDFPTQWLDLVNGFNETR